MVFDNIDYKISIAGITINADNLANIKYGKSIGNKGFRGVSTSQFSFDFYWPACPIEVTEGLEVEFLTYTWLPPFFAANISISGDIATVTAYDSCKNLDIPFGYSKYEQFDGKGTGKENVKWYSSSSVVGDIAAQCGFSGSSGSMRVQQLCYNDIAGKSCRQILEDLSAASCGFWSAGASNVLTFKPFNHPYSGTAREISEEYRTAIVNNDCKYIRGIYAQDEIYGTTAFIGYNPGESSDSWRYIEKISGRYITKENALEIAAQILGSDPDYAYRGWSVSAVETESIFSPGEYILNGSLHLPVLSVSYDFGAMVIASLSAPAPDNSYSAYSDYYSRQIDERVTIGKMFGCAAINNNGFNLVSKSEAVVNSG